MSLARGILRGAAAGAAGTTALNAVTYLDMAVRGRPASSAPQTAVRTIAGKLGVLIPDDDETAENRVAGLGPMLGILTGIGVGMVLGAARGTGWRPALPLSAAIAALGAMVGSDLPMTGLGISDARHWSLADWLSDAVPHVVFGLVAAAVAAATDPAD